MKKIAVIVPVYNGEKFLSEFIISLLKQTINNFEVYFVDDCSTDRTSVLLEKVVSENKNFHYLRNANRYGAAVSRNIGITESKSEYVLCLDADDLVAEDLMEQLEKVANIYCPDMVMLERSDFIRTDSIRRKNIFLNDDVELYKDSDVSNELCTFRVKEQPKDFLLRCLNGTCDRMIKRELLNKYHIHFQDLPSSNDVFYTILATFAADCIVHTQTDDFLYYRRIHSEPGRISNNRDPMCAFEALYAVKEALMQYHMWKDCCIHFWIFALDSLEKQLFVCKNEDRQREVYQYLQNEGLKRLGVSEDLLYNNLPACYKKQFERLLTVPFEDRCFENSMTYHALCESRQEKIHDIFAFAEEENLRIGYWGIGRMTEGFISVAERMGKKVDFLIDNNMQKQGQKVFNMEIVAFNNVAQKTGFIIVSNKQYFHEVYKQIKDANEKINVLCIQEYLYCNKKLEECIR